MGGLNLAVRNVTGKGPDAYLSDYRNRNNFRMQEVKEAIGVESRTTVSYTHLDVYKRQRQDCNCEQSVVQLGEKDGDR